MPRDNPQAPGLDSDRSSSVVTVDLAAPRWAYARPVSVRMRQTSYGIRFSQSRARLPSSAAAGEARDRADQAHGDAAGFSLAYSPGVAAACLDIKDNPDTAHDYTARGNVVAVISNGTAVLGLGNIGALAGKPVMEGKAVLFKKFAGVDVFDMEVDAADPARFCDVVAALNPPSARSISRTSRLPSASRSKPNCASGCRSRSFTTTSTAPPSSSRRPCATACFCKARGWTRAGERVNARGPRRTRNNRQHILDVSPPIAAATAYRGVRLPRLQQHRSRDRGAGGEVPRGRIGRRPAPADQKLIRVRERAEHVRILLGIEHAHRLLEIHAQTLPSCKVVCCSCATRTCWSIRRPSRLPK